MASTIRPFENITRPAASADKSLIALGTWRNGHEGSSAIKRDFPKKVKWKKVLWKSVL